MDLQKTSCMVILCGSLKASVFLIDPKSWRPHKGLLLALTHHEDRDNCSVFFSLRWLGLG